MKINWKFNNWKRSNNIKVYTEIKGELLKYLIKWKSKAGSKRATDPNLIPNKRPRYGIKNYKLILLADKKVNHISINMRLSNLHDLIKAKALEKVEGR